VIPSDEAAVATPVTERARAEPVDRPAGCSIGIG